MVAKGPPGSYSPQVILMRHGGQAQRYRQPTLEAESTEEELKAISEAIAAGVVTPAPGLHGQPKTPAIGATGAPTTPGVAPQTPRTKRPADEGAQEEAEGTESPRKGHEKRESQDEAAKRQKVQEEEEKVDVAMASNASRPRDEGTETHPAASPTKMARLYPPHFAGIQSIEAHGDEEFDYEMVPEEVTEELQGDGGEEEEPLIATDEHVRMLDQEAKSNEVDRMVSVPVMEEVKPDLISTKFVYCTGSSVEDGSGERVWWPDSLSSKHSRLCQC